MFKQLRALVHHHASDSCLEIVLPVQMKLGAVTVRSKTRLPKIESNTLMTINTSLPLCVSYDYY